MAPRLPSLFSEDAPYRACLPDRPRHAGPHQFCHPATHGLASGPIAPLDRQTRDGVQPDRRDIGIGHDAWMSAGAMTLSGARIGHGAITGAGSPVRIDGARPALERGDPDARAALADTGDP